MSRRRKTDDEDDGGLDSLLDTMTNVVGILVLVLIVTQMSVSEVVDRIIADSDIDEAAIAEAEEAMSLKQREVEELETRLIDPTKIDTERQRREIELKRELIERRRRQLSQAETEQNQFVMRVERDRERASANIAENERIKASRDELEAELQTLLRQRASLKASLDRTPRQPAPPNIRVSVPDPQPPPKGARPVFLVAAGDRIVPLNVQGFQAEAAKAARAIAARNAKGRGPDAAIDAAAFTEAWTKLKRRDAMVDVEYFVADRREPKLRLHIREGVGATAEQFRDRRSFLWSRRWLGGVDFSRSYVRFYVLPDGFAVYADARRILDRNDVPTGWQPQPQDWTFTAGVPGGVRLGPDRGEQPKPKRNNQNLVD